MSLARLQDVSMSFSGVPVFSGLDFRVEKGEKIGLIGRNGTGKSTLFRLISRRIPPESGLVEHMKRVRIAYLAQLPEVPLETGIFELVRSHFPEILEQQETLTKLEERIAGGDEGALEEYGTLQEAFHLSGGYDFESTIKRVLCGLGFRESEFDLRYGSLSGGQRTRLLLALLLLEEADLLLLDEPENHLDLQAREWLESFLRDWPNAFVIISHDRRMLNEVTTRTVELDRGKLRGFSGNYDAYLREKGRVDADQEKQYARQQEHIAKEQKWIDRFRYKNTKSRQVQSRIKRLKKLKRIEAVDEDASTVKLAMGEVVRSGQIVLKGEGLSMAYDDLALYHDVTLQVERGERVGIIGPNGSGKTTFLKHLAGRLSGGRGSVSLGHKTKLGYFDQQLNTVNDSNDVLSEIGLTVPDWTPQRIRSFMGRFLFVGEDVFKSIGTLSGGERSRVALAKLVLSGANLLLLDEPTNHLDIASREALEASLAEFPGTIVLVSHDRELIDRLVDKLVIIEDGRGMVHLGNYAHYRWKTDTQGPGETGDAMRIRKKKVRSVTSGQAREKERRKDRKRFGELETAIEEAEAQIELCEQGFTQMDPADYESLAAARGEYDTLKGALSTLYEEWDALSSRLSEPGSEA